MVHLAFMGSKMQFLWSPHRKKFSESIPSDIVIIIGSSSRSNIDNWLDLYGTVFSEPRIPYTPYGPLQTNNQHSLTFVQGNVCPAQRPATGIHWV